MVLNSKQSVGSEVERHRHAVQAGVSLRDWLMRSLWCWCCPSQEPSVSVLSLPEVFSQSTSWCLPLGTLLIALFLKTRPDIQLVEGVSYKQEAFHTVSMYQSLLWFILCPLRTKETQIMAISRSALLTAAQTFGSAQSSPSSSSSPSLPAPRWPSHTP